MTFAAICDVGGRNGPFSPVGSLPGLPASVRLALRIPTERRSKSAAQRL